MILPINYKTASPLIRRLAREQYVQEQNGICCYCKCSFDSIPKRNPKVDIALENGIFPLDFLTHPIHLHHSHKTGLTLGAIHAYCNAKSWILHNE